MTDDELTLDERVIALAIGAAVLRIRQSAKTPKQRTAIAKGWARTLVELVNDETWHPTARPAAPGFRSMSRSPPGISHPS